MPQTKSTGNRSAQSFLGVDGIHDRILWTSGKYLFAFLAVQGRDNSLLDDDDNAGVTEQLTVAIAEQTEPWQLLSIPRMVDISGMLQELAAMKEQAENTPQLRLLNGEINTLEAMRRNGAREPVILLKIWRRASSDAAVELLRRANILQTALRQQNISARILEDDDILQLCRIYADLDTWLPRETTKFDVPLLPGWKRPFTSQKHFEEKSIREDLLEKITPVGGLFFKPNELHAGSVCARCYGITKFPAEVKYGWAVDLMNADDSITCITYTPGSPALMGEALSRSVSQERRDAASSRDAREQKSHERKSRSADQLLDSLDGKGMSVGHVSVVTMPFASTPELLEITCRRVISRFAAKKMTLRKLTAVQRQAFQHICPYYPAQEVIQQMLQRIFPLETLMGGYPMTSTVVRDDHGLYFATTPDGRIITLDIRERSADRTNGHGIVTGPSGIGKSTAIKHILQSRYMSGDHCILFDPEREYRDLCKNLGGSWWAAGGGGARLNLFHIFPVPPDDEEKKEFRTDMRPVFQHIQQIRTVLHYMFPSLSDVDMALLEDAVIKLYSQFGIGINTSEEAIRALPANRFPIMSDLYALLQKWESRDRRYKKLSLLLKSMAEGADSEIWNGHTNIDLDNRLVVIDTKELQGMSRENQVAQYYNLLTMAHSKASQDLTTPYFILADEAQTLLDPELPQAAKKLKDMALRLRKREGCLWLVFHSLHELLDQRIRMEGQAILDTAAYKILFGTSGQNLADTVELFQVTEAERKILKAQLQRKALCIIGGRHIQANFELPAYKLELMGKGGGR